MMPAFLWFVFAHCILDYPMQGEFLSKFKSKYFIILLMHALIWGLGMSALLEILQLDYTNGKMLFLVGGHMIMDLFKCSGYLGKLLNKVRPGMGDDPLGIQLWIDQLFHMWQILMVL